MRLIIFFALFFNFIAGESLAMNLDSLVTKKVAIEKPYLIINIPTTECVTCRAGGVYLLRKLQDSQFKKKIIILSDDKNMAFYFRKNKDIYNGYTAIYDKELSAALARGPSATACLFESAGEHRYLLNQMSNDTAHYIKNALEGASHHTADYRRFKIKDSIFAQPVNLSFGRYKAILFNSKFQVGLQYDLIRNTVTYLQPEYNDSTLEILNRIISPMIYRELTNAKETRAELHFLGIDPISIDAFDINNNNVLFKQYVVYTRISSDFKDTDTYALPQVLLAQKDKGSNNLFDFNNTNAFFFIDSLHYRGDTLQPLENYYQVHNGDLFIPYWDSKHSKSRNIDGREISMATCVYIVKYKNYAKNKKPDYDIYKIYDTAKGPGNYFLRVDADNDPVIVSKTNQSITFLGKNAKLKFSDFPTVDGQAITKFFDAVFTNDTMWFAAVTDKNNCVKGYRSLTSGTTKMENLSTQLLYESMSINGKELLGCKRNSETEELFFDVFSLN